ncbi:hypothetical protein [Lihuaxuella thermophila]|uniref:YtkA-like n=1 Tax=Lihuaxuella thermophila TaxID=1173111 RepID=A0A1H8JPZ0_9BACL|nr:hypothetical protein [Lihuaxuella thermophila]SEN82258.1 hypothetical protein SAMN05444955_1331 [Lihuaxuella thermophila]
MKKGILLGASFFVAAGLFISGCGNMQDANQHGQHNNSGHGAHGTEHRSDSSGKAGDTKVHAAWAFSDSKPRAGQPQQLTIQINGHDGKPVQDFEINHEKKMHLIIVSQDLSYFHHIHPEFKGNGKFQITTQFPHGGKYKLIADLIPKGGTQTTQTTWVDVEGTPAKSADLKPDQTMVQTVDGKEIKLSFDKEIKPGQEVMLNFQIKDAKTKQPVTDLQPYLGAVGHVVILSADTENYLHVHPMDEKATGPDARFHTTFPRGGIYKIWGEFQHQGKVFTVSYVVNVSGS